MRKMKELTKRLLSTERPSIVVNSLDGKILDANNNYMELTGYSLDELKTLRYQDLTPDKWHAEEEELFKQVLKEGHCSVYHKEYKRKDGSIVPIENQAWLFEEDGERKLLGVIKEID